MTVIKYNKTAIGVVNDAGKTLDKRVFHALWPISRLRAYLLLVYPQARTARCLSRACRIPQGNIPGFLKGDVRAGVMHYEATLGSRALPQTISPPPLTLVQQEEAS